MTLAGSGLKQGFDSWPEIKLGHIRENSEY